MFTVKKKKEGKKNVGDQSERKGQVQSKFCVSSPHLQSSIPRPTTHCVWCRCRLWQELFCSPWRRRRPLATVFAVSQRSVHLALFFLSSSFSLPQAWRSSSQEPSLPRCLSYFKTYHIFRVYIGSNEQWFAEFDAFHAGGKAPLKESLFIFYSHTLSIRSLGPRNVERRCVSASML